MCNKESRWDCQVTEGEGAEDETLGSIRIQGAAEKRGPMKETMERPGSQDRSQKGQVSIWQEGLIVALDWSS